jgi:hypothetical protein
MMPNRPLPRLPVRTERPVVTVVRVSPAARADLSARVIGVVLGLAGPIALGVATGHLDAGALAATGGLAVSGADSADSPFRRRVLDLGWALAAGCAALLASCLILLCLGRGWLAALAMVALAGLAALVGGVSRPLAYAGIRSITFLLIAQGIAPRASEHVVGALLVFVLLDLAQPTTISTIIFRLADTAIGCAIAMSLGYLVWPRRYRTAPDGPTPAQPVTIL